MTDTVLTIAKLALLGERITEDLTAVKSATSFSLFVAHFTWNLKIYIPSLLPRKKYPKYEQASYHVDICRNIQDKL